MSGHSSTLNDSAAERPWRGVTAVAAGALDTFLRWQELARQRRALLSLDARMLADIGVSQADAAREAARPFWHDPLREPAERHAAGVVQTLRPSLPVLNGR